MFLCGYGVVTRDLYLSKHGGVRSLFDRHFVKDGPFSREMSRFYHDLFNSRQDGDYKDFVTFEREEVEAWLAQAEAFVAVIGKYIDDERNAGAAD